jgi:hypothetical protein
MESQASSAGGEISSNLQTLALLDLTMSNKKMKEKKKDGDRFLVHVGRSQPSEIGFTVNTHGVKQRQCPERQLEKVLDET